MLKVRRARADEFDQVLDFYTNMIDGMRGTEFDVCWEHDVHLSRIHRCAQKRRRRVHVVLPAHVEFRTAHRWMRERCTWGWLRTARARPASRRPWC